MKEPQLNPQVADLAPIGPALTVYDEEHMITYMRVFDADQQGADWREVCRIVLRIDPDTEADRARLAYESHLSRARWMTEQGYRHLLEAATHDHRDAASDTRDLALTLGAVRRSRLADIH
jgi:hypothetical protein